MKKVIILLSSLVILLCGCVQSNRTGENAVFTKIENENLISPSGVEYAHLANEGILYYLGELEFVGSIQSEERPLQAGMFAIKNSDNDNILIRRVPDNEWFSIYRKASFPKFDFSADNCIRLEFVSGTGDIREDSIHTTCKGGICDESEITEFLSEVRAQENPHDARLYDLIKKPNGMLENCYVYGVVYGFFEEEPNLAIRMNITSYNDLSYSISIGENEYVLPENLLSKLLNSKCTP